MGFLDDLDSAFDNLLSGDGPAQPTTTPTEIVTDDLANAIADQQSAVVQALLVLIDEAPRRILLPALAASIHYFLEIEAKDSSRATAAKTMGDLLKTQRGTVRQRLNQRQRQALHAQQAAMVLASELETSQAKTLLKALSKMSALPADAIHSLYAAGIWRGDQIHVAVLDQLAAVSGWTDEDLAELAKHV